MKRPLYVCVCVCVCVCIYIYIYIYIYSSCPKWIAIVFKFLQHLKAHTLPGSTTFQPSPQPFAHTSAARQTQAQHLLPVHQMLLVMIGRLPIWLKATKLNHTEKKNRDIMRVNLLVNVQCTAHENYCDATHEQKKQYAAAVQLA